MSIARNRGRKRWLAKLGISSTRRPIAVTVGRRLALDQLEDRRLLTGVITIGDSWAWLVAANAPGSAPPAPGFTNQLGAALPGVPVYDESFGGGTAAQHLAQVADIVARVNAHPDADIVYLSSGGNDMLLGAAGGWVYNSGNNPNVYAAIQSNVQAITDAILAIRPDIQVVIASYDYPNLWDGSLAGSAGDQYRALYGIVRADTGNGALNQFLNLQQNSAWNQGFRDAEAGKIAVANASRRVHEVYNFGQSSSLFGYTGALGTVSGQGFYGPDQWPDLPIRNSLLNDPIHLNSTGYSFVANNVKNNFFNTALQAAVLSTSTGTIDLGPVRVGTTAAGSVTASNTGPNFTKVKNLFFPTGAGDFSGGNQSFNPLFKDPTLGSDQAAVSYSYTPGSRGADAQNLTLTSDSGNRALALAGLGVGPVAQLSNNSISINPLAPNASGSAGLTITNATTDGNLGSLTNLKLLSANIGGADAARFQLTGFTPGMTLSAANIANLGLNFTGAPTGGTYQATLTFTTDQGAAAGTSGQQFTVNLSAVVVGPPLANPGGPYTGSEGTIALHGSGAGAITNYDWDLDNNGSYETPGQNVNFTPADQGNYTIGLRVTGLGGTGTATTTVAVTNAVPVASLAAPVSTPRGALATFTLSALDPASADQAAGFTFDIDWDANGSIDQTVTGLSGTTVQHAFDVVGAHLVRLVATDKDGGISASSTATAVVSAVTLVADVDQPSLTNLVWTGTSADDSVRFEQVDTTTVRVVTLKDNGVAVNFVQTFAGVNGVIIATALAGSDVLDASALKATAARLEGDEGDDQLSGGAADDHLSGGDNNDTLVGGLGNNQLDAGEGNNTVYGTAVGNSGVTAPGDNHITAGNGANTIYGNYSGNGGEGGNNTIEVGDGQNTIYGNFGGNGRKGGDNTIVAGNGTGNVVYGNFGGNGGEGGNNTIETGDGGATIYGNFGGDGGEGGNNLIVAGAGNDTIYGNFNGSGTANARGGRNLIVGGDGADTIFSSGQTPGNQHEAASIMLAGSTLLTLTDLKAVQSEWTSNRSYTDRVANIAGTGVGDRNNGGAFLQASVNVANDLAIDQLWGESGAVGDWFLATVGIDGLHNLDPGETATNTP